ncbi:MAG: hypothetical protein ACOC47_04960 [Alkalispirochaetaceae bacterium]
MSIRRQHRLLRENFSALHLFLTGAITLPAYLLQDNLYVRLAQVLLFAALASVAGKRIKWLYFLVMVSSITFFHLLVPMGRVIVEVGPLPITEAALRNGLLKGLTIVGLVFISLFSVRSDLKLPGRLGGLVARLFFYFERIMEGEHRIEARRVIASVDEALSSIYAPGVPTQEVTLIEGAARVSSGWARAAMVLFVTVHWLALFV